MDKVCIEAALNGPWGKSRQPLSPISIDACISDGIACAKAGAAIIHVHAFDPETGEQCDRAETYRAIINGIQNEVDAIVSPTIPLPGWVETEVMNPTERFAHITTLANDGLLEMLVTDPGSMNMATYEAIEQGEHGVLYPNPVSHIHKGLDIADEYGLCPSFAIFEPGFIRLGAAIARLYPSLGTPFYRFMFSETYTFNYPPERYALDSLVTLLQHETSDAEWMLSGLGVDVTSLIPETVSKGGHLRVGLEDAPLGSCRTNEDWVLDAKHEVENAGGEVASPSDIRAIM